MRIPGETTTLALSESAAKPDRLVSGMNRGCQLTTSLAEGGDTSIMYAL